MKIPFLRHDPAADNDDSGETRVLLPEVEDYSDTPLALILAFILPTAIMLGILAGKGIYPFGDNSFLRTDMYHQYAPFFAEFCRTLKNGGSLNYSFEIGLGTNFQALYAYYLSSPLNWLVFFVPQSLIVEFMTYTIVAKIGLCGLSLAWYLKHHFRTDSLAVTFFGVCYAMCGYIAAYSWNIMWMDSLWLAPLILLGLEKLVRDARPMMYVITLGLAILCNYYIAIMICIFLVLYFICEMILLPDMTIRKFFGRGLLFAFYSLLGGGFAAVLLIPAAMALMGTASADTSFPTELVSYFGVLEMLARHMVCVETEIGLDHWPNIYSGVACFFLLPVYVISPKIPLKKKIVQITLLVIMLLSFSLNIPNYIWHGMHFPNSLPCRQSFLYTIVLLAMCYEGLQNLKYLTKGQIAACFWGDIGFILLLQLLIEEEEVVWYSYYLSILFLALYMLFVWLWRTGHLKAVTSVCMCLVILTAETGINMAVTSVTTTSRSEYWRNTENYQKLIQTAEDLEGDDFFRVEKSTRRTKNDAAWVGYDSASIFSSATEAGVSDFYTLFGLEGNTNAYSFSGATPLMEALLSVKYRISSTEMGTDALREYVCWEDTAYLYHNMYTLPLGFMLPNDISSYFTDYMGDPAEAQNDFVSMTAGTGPVLETQECSNIDGTCSFDVAEDGHYYAYIGNASVEYVDVTGNNDADSFENVDRGYLLDLGTCYSGQTVTLSSDDSSTLNASIYKFNESNFIAWYNQMSTQTLDITDFTNDRSGTSITGTIDVTTAGTLFLSIPYEDGWTVTVDGQEVTASPFVNAFLSLNLSQGTHTVSMTYHTSGQRTGLLISLVSLLLIILSLIFYRIRDRRLARLAQRERAAMRRQRRAEMHRQRETLKDTALTPSQDSTVNDTAATQPENPAASDAVSSGEILLEDEEYLDGPEDGSDM